MPRTLGAARAARPQHAAHIRCCSRGATAPASLALDDLEEYRPRQARAVATACPPPSSLALLSPTLYTLTPPPPCIPSPPHPYHSLPPFPQQGLLTSAVRAYCQALRMLEGLSPYPKEVQFPH